MADWKSELDKVFGDKENQEAETSRRLEQLKSGVPAYFETVVVPAFNELKEQLEKRDRQVEVRGNQDSASIEVRIHGVMEIHYAVHVLIWPTHVHLYVATKLREGGKSLRGESSIKRGSEDSIENITKEDIVSDFLRLYKGQIGR